MGAKDVQRLLPSAGADYPRNRDYKFAHRFVRLLAKTVAINEIGPSGFVLLTMIAMTEHSRFYKSPPTFFNGQLLQFLGNLSDDALCRLRKRCVDAGWLHYERSHKREAGIYWVVIPLQYEDIPDGPLGEMPEDFHAAPVRDETRDETRNEPRMKRGIDRGSNAPPPSISFSESKSTPTQASEAAAVERILKKLQEVGVGLFVETLDEARDHGLALDAIEAVVDHYRSRPGAWGAGALRLRLISRSAPRLAPQDGWPPPAAAERERAIQARTQADTVALRERRQQDTVRQAELKQLEFGFGPALDALPRDELRALIQSMGLGDPNWLLKVGKGRAPAVIRPQLLAALKARSEAN